MSHLVPVTMKTEVCALRFFLFLSFFFFFLIMWTSLRMRGLGDFTVAAF